MKQPSGATDAAFLQLLTAYEVGSTAIIIQFGWQNYLCLPL